MKAFSGNPNFDIEKYLEMNENNNMQPASTIEIITTTGALIITLAAFTWLGVRLNLTF